MCNKFYGKIQGFTKVSSMCPLGNRNVLINKHGNLSNRQTMTSSSLELKLIKYLTTWFSESRLRSYRVRLSGDSV